MKSKKLLAALTTFLLLGAPRITYASTINYTIKNGDTLWNLSQTYKTTINQMASINSIDKNNYLYIGQTLKIDDNRLKHTVISGDSLWKLSQKYSVTISDIKKANNLNNDWLYIGQVLIIPNHISESQYTASNNENVSTVNHKVAFGDNLWSISQKYKTSMEAIKKSNVLASEILMPGQILTVPVNSTAVVSPKGITMLKRRVNDNYGDLYTWENARRIFTVGQRAKLVDLENSELCFNVKYYGGSNHADIVPLHYTDTNKMKLTFGAWSWNKKRPMILKFTQGNTEYQLAVSVTGMPHGTTDIYDNQANGHFDMYFYNSTSHVSNELSQTHQNNVLKANGQ
jgi:LysM repeat protein